MAPDELGPTQHSAYPGSTADQIDPRTYGQEPAEGEGEQLSEADMAATQIANAKADGSLLKMTTAEREDLYQRAYGHDTEGILQDDKSRTALDVNAADQDFADPTALRRAFSNALGPLIGDAEQQQATELARVAHGLGLNTFDVAHAGAFNSVAESGEQAWSVALRDDVQLSRLTSDQQAKVAKMVQQAVQENPSARELMETTDIERSVGLQMALGRKAARMMSREGKL